MAIVEKETSNDRWLRGDGRDSNRDDGGCGEGGDCLLGEDTRDVGFGLSVDFYAKQPQGTKGDQGINQSNDP